MSSPLPVSDSEQIIGNLFKVAAHRDCPFHSNTRGVCFVTVALIVRLLCPVISRCAVPVQSGLSSVTVVTAMLFPTAARKVRTRGLQNQQNFYVFFIYFCLARTRVNLLGLVSKERMERENVRFFGFFA